MSVLNMSKAGEALKLFYLDGFQHQLNNANPIISVMERDTKSVVGSEIRMALRHGRHGGIGNRADDGILPTPNSRKTKQAKWDTKNIFARIHISDKTMRSSRGEKGAFASLLEADLEDAKNDAQDSQGRQLFGDGKGTLGTFGAHTTLNTLTVTPNVELFSEGQFIDIVASDGTVKESQREVTIVDYDNNTITISGTAVTTVATDIAVIFGNYDEELTGFGAVFQIDTTLYGINRATNKWFNPTLDTPGTAREISEVAIQKNIDDVDKRAGGKTNFLCSSYGVRRAYQDLLLATKRTTDVMKLKGGWDALTYNNMPFAVDKYSPANTIYGLDLSTWRMYHIMDWDWLDDDGAVLSRVADKAVWEATLARYMDIGCSKVKGNFKMDNIIEH
jgi:hypothetical protein